MAETTPTLTTPLLAEFGAGDILAWAIANPWWTIAIIVALIFGINYGLKKGWERLTLMYQMQGKPLPPLSFTMQRAMRLMFKEDNTPVITNAKHSDRWAWLTWQKYWQIAATLLAIAIAAVILYTSTLAWILLAAASTAILVGIGHVRKIFNWRHQLLMQMFEVANVEMRYPRGAELNPWGYIDVTEWTNLYYPKTTIVKFPPKYRGDDQRNRTAFEGHFNGTVSSQHTWAYTWEPSANRVVCEPVPFIDVKADYPFPDQHPWDEFPLGKGAAQEEVVWSVSSFPHVLVAGTTGSGKACTLDTPIPTPTGWTTMGEIRVGDQVFDELGNPTTVVGMSDINHTPDLYRVTFSDGSTLDVDNDHLWWTDDRAARESRGRSARLDGARARRPLLTSETIARVRGVAISLTDEQAITIGEAASILGVHPTSPWLIALANELGHVGEVQLVGEFTYAEQEVLQQQNVTVYPALTALDTLLSPAVKARAAWHSLHGEFQRLANNAVGAQGGDAWVSARDIAAVTDLPAKTCGGLVRSKGVAGVNNSTAIGLLYPAREAWQALADASAPEVFPWQTDADAVTRLKELRASTGATDTVTSVDLHQLLHQPNLTATRTIMKRLGVPSHIEKREVALQVPGKTVKRGQRYARTYQARRLLEAAVEYGQHAVNDQRQRKITGAVRTTGEIAATLNVGAQEYSNHSIPVTKALHTPEATLPVPPYLLGVWLGDGDSRGSTFGGVDHEIADHIRTMGYRVSEREVANLRETQDHNFRLWNVHGLAAQLRALGILQRATEEGSQKRIPAEYLRASIAQRADLLAGLLDTDGTVAPQGTVQFTNTNRVLAFQVHELALTLGYRATIIEGRATLEGRDYGPKWTISWTCKESPFRLTRKTDTHRERNQSYNAERNSHRYIVSVDAIPSRPARCIMVDSPNRLFLAGEAMIPTHNSVTQGTILMHALQSPEWRIVLVDPKRVELSAYRGHPNVLRVATELEDSVELIEQIEQEMQARYKRMEEAGTKHFRGLQPAPPAVLLMVDETFSLLSPTGIRSDEGKAQDEMKARIGVLLSSIARLGRASGIHMVLATQRPDAKVLPGELKANLDARIAQGRMDTTPSLMTLDSDAATKLPAVKGRAILRQGKDNIEFQAYFLSEQQLGIAIEMSAMLVRGEITKDEILGKSDDDEGDGSGKRRLPSVSLPSIPVPEKLRGGVAAWVAKRKAAIEANEQKSQDAIQAHQDKKRSKAGASPAVGSSAPLFEAPAPSVAPPMLPPVSPEQPSGQSAVASDGMALFDRTTFAAPSDLFEGDSGGPVSAGSGVESYDEFDDDEFDDDFVEYGDDDGEPLPVGGGSASDVASASVAEVPVASVTAPAVVEAPPAAPAAPAVSVQEVMRRAAERGVPIPASELLAALRAEAARQAQLESQAAASAAAAEVTPPAPAAPPVFVPPTAPPAPPAPPAGPVVPIAPVVPPAPPSLTPAASPMAPPPAVPPVPELPPVESVPAGPRRPSRPGPVTPAASESAAGGADEVLEAPWMPKSIPAPPSGPSPFGLPPAPPPPAQR